MCGIVGIIDISGKPIAPKNIIDMNSAIAHRGPDDEGYCLINQSDSRMQMYSGSNSSSEIKDQLPCLLPIEQQAKENIALGHRRFGIIDLSTAGHQPFWDHDRTHCLIFNGEIYNYVELRAELESLGVRFYTQSDTEVFIEAYKKWSHKAFDRFNGFWSAAIYEMGNKRLFLTRDRLGKKPLYWAKVGTIIYFASEIKALLRVSDVYKRRAVNTDAVFQWLVYGRKDYCENTFFKGIYAFPAASWALLDSRFPENITPYWQLPKHRLSENEKPVEHATSELKELLMDAVAIRQRADVPVALELSGGLDSSAIAACVAKNKSQKFTSFTVRFADPKWNEEPFARSVAEHLGLDYKVLDPPLTRFWENIHSFTYLEEEPYHAPNLYTNQLIWSQMRGMETKVSLNGAGGDEVFAGYGTYFSSLQLELLQKGQIARYVKNGINHTESSRAVWGLTRPFAKLLWKTFEHRFLIPVIGKNRRIVKDIAYKPSVFHSTASLSQTLYSDLTRTLMPYWLASGDRGYMGVPLEVRAPFLDYRILEFAFQLPVSYLIRDGWHKWILRKALEDMLPQDVLWRKNKLGFPFPYDRFCAENREIFLKVLNQANNPYIDLSRTEEITKNWRMMSFVLWYEFFFNENFSLFSEIEDMANSRGDFESQDFTPAFFETCRAGK